MGLEGVYLDKGGMLEERVEVKMSLVGMEMDGFGISEVWIGVRILLMRLFLVKKDMILENRGMR